jgi:tight adherence protein B
MSETLGLLGASLLLLAGLALTLSGLRQRRRMGVERLRAALGSVEAPAAERAQLAAAWSELSRVVERVGEGTSLGEWIEDRIERAGWPLRAGEYALLTAGAGALGAILFAGLVAPLPGILLGGPLGAFVPLALLQRQAQRNAARADEQLPEVLDRMAASLRAGHSLVHAMESVAERGAAPLGPEFARVLAETDIGRPFDEAMEAMAARVGSVDLRWSVRAILIQSRTGGRLADLLEVLAEFMRDREEVRREVRALTADGRISALVLIGLPIGVAAALLVVSPGYLAPLVTEPFGIALLTGAILLMALSTLWIRRLVRIDV